MGNGPDNRTLDALRKAAYDLRYYWPLLFASLLLIAIEWPVLSEWWRVWNAPYSYFSHGPLVPFIAGYMVWANRKKLALADTKPCWAGVLILAAAVMLFVFGNWIASASLRALVFVMMIFGILLVLLGVRVTRLLSVPVFCSIAPPENCNCNRPPLRRSSSSSPATRPICRAQRSTPTAFPSP